MKIKTISIVVKMIKSLELAITNIGDLLLNNRITKNHEGKSIFEIQLAIPNYQRPYKWSAKNANLLLDDILTARELNKESYRLGTLILNEKNKNQNDQKEKNYRNFDIVDGQQRCITLSLLLHALFNSKLERINRKIQTQNLENEEVKIDFLKQNLIENSHNILNVRNNYLTLKRRIDNLSKEECNDLLSFIISQCELIVVITQDISEAFQFFDSQNSRGKKLYPHDLLKAYHLREMGNLHELVIEKVVKIWEDIPQKELSILFSDYLYRIYMWSKGNRAIELNEGNIEIFKGISHHDNYPYSQYYKGAYSFAENTNKSLLPFVTGGKFLNPFQLNTPIIAGKPFFDYAKHYYEILKDIQNNDKYEGYFINDNEIVKTLDLKQYKSGVGNRISRLLFDTIILLYVDRFCPDKPSKLDLKLLDHFVVFAFVWSYSLRAQYINLGWQSAQNYILGNEEKQNSINLYKIISDSEKPQSLFSTLSQLLLPLSQEHIKDPNFIKGKNIETIVDIPENYSYFFKKYQFLNP